MLKDPRVVFCREKKELAPFLHDPEVLRFHLGLPDVPLYISEVHVPMSKELFVGRIGPQPTFGLMGKSGFQYKSVGKLPL